jgi:hypothetical protein
MFYHIQFKKNSKFALVNGKTYSKSQIYKLLVTFKHKNKIKYSNCRKTIDTFQFHYSIKVKKKMLRVHITMDQNDSYYILLDELEHMVPKSVVLKTRVALGVLAASLVLTKTSIVTDVMQVSPFSIEDNEISFDDLFDLDIDDPDDFVLTYVNEEWLQNEDNYKLSYIKPYVSILNVDSSLEETMESIANQNIEHASDLSYFYDEEANNFYFDTMYETIRKNSEEAIRAHKNVTEVTLTDDEWIGLIQKLYDFIEFSKEENPNFDVEGFICKLKEVSIYKNSNLTDNNKNTYGSYASHFYEIIFNIFQNERGKNSTLLSDCEVLDTDAWESVINHEYVHLAEDYCPCFSLEEFKSMGISIKLPVTLSRKYSFIWVLQPYDYLFTYEWSAEKYSSLMENGEVSTYFTENYVMDSLEYALSIQPDYQLGSILNETVTKDPIAFYSEFPYLYDTKEELEDYVEMLACYDYSFGNDITSFVLACSSYELPEVLESQAIHYLHYYAQVKHVELFYKNLYLLNESSKEDISEYSKYLIRLFQAIMKKQEQECFSGINVDLDNILSDGYLNFYNHYLVLKYPNLEFELSDDDSLKEFDSFPSFVDEEKCAYYRKLANELTDSIYDNARELIKK